MNCVFPESGPCYYRLPRAGCSRKGGEVCLKVIRDRADAKAKAKRAALPAINAARKARWCSP